MSKLFKLKQFLTVPEAAKHLAGAFNEDVTEADILQLAIDRHLTLSVNFMNNVWANAGETLPLNAKELTKRIQLGRNGKLCETPETVPGFISVASHIGKSVDEVTMFDECIIKTGGLNDLLLIDDESFYLKRKYLILTGGAEVTPSDDASGIIVFSMEEVHFLLLKRYDENPYCSEELKQKLETLPLNDPRRYYPAGDLPEDAVLVVRAEALTEFIQRLEDPKPTSTDKPLMTMERDTLLTIIEVLCKDSGIDSQERGTAAEIQRMAEKAGINISDDTIKRHIGKIPDALERRSK